MITGALIGGCVASGLVFWKNDGLNDIDFAARIVSLFTFCTCLGALIGSNF